jgi:hypothetical protein
VPSQFVAEGGRRRAEIRIAVGSNGVQIIASNATPSTSIRVLSRSELARLRVITPDRPAPRRAGRERG